LPYILGEEQIYWIYPEGLEKVPPEIEYFSRGAITYDQLWAKININNVIERMQYVYKNQIKQINYKKKLRNVEDSTDELVDYVDYISKQKKSLILKRKNKTLFVQPMSLGDIFLISAVINGYRKKYPDEELYLMTKEKYYWLFEDCNWIHLLPYPDPFYNEMYRSPYHISTEMGFLKVFRTYEKPQLDAKWTKGYAFAKKIHMIEHYASVCGLRPEEIGVPYIPEKSIEMEKLARPIIVLHTMTFDDTKNWGHFQKLVNILNCEKKYYIFQVGNKKDMLLNGVIDYREKSYKNVINLLKLAKYFIGIDSFFAHICGFLNLEGVVIFGGTYAPYCKPYWGRLKILEPEKRVCGLKFPCHQARCFMGNKCINSITVDKIKEILGNKR